jgi:chromosome segregation ATPase
MKRAWALALICCATAVVALAQEQQPATADGSPPPPDTGVATSPAGTTAPSATPDSTPPASESSPPTPSETPVNAPPDTQTAPAPDPASGTGAQGAREVPLDVEAFDARVRRRVAEYNQRHQQREREMASYDRVSGTDPGLGRFADPRKAQVELSDELDREQTSEELAGDYAERAHDLQGKVQVLQDFIAKRRQTLGELGNQNGASHRPDLEVALANLARQPESPETLAEMREIDRQLSEADRNEKEVPAQLAQAQQEATDAAEELTKLKTLAQSYEKESKAFTADALSARQNRLRLANRLEYYVVRAQAEDELEQGRKAMESVQHLSASPEVESALNGSGSSGKSDAELQQMRACIQESGDVKACRGRVHQE